MTKNPTFSHSVLIAAALTSLLAVVLATAAVFVLRSPSSDEPTPSAVDIGFAQDMAVHHDQAVLMASIARVRGSAPVAGVAATMEVGQASEAGTLRGWLMLWREPTLPRDDPMKWMVAKHGHSDNAAARSSSGDAMPGMATMPQIEHLRSLTGDAFDREFVRLMVRHHEGGIEMAKAAAELAALPTTRDFAQLVIVAQSQEIAELRALAAPR